MSKVSESPPLTALDKETYCGTSQVLKAAVSYMDPSSGKMVAMLARILELKQTMELFDSEQLSICSIPSGSRPGMEEILKDIKKYCAPAESEQIDQFLNMLSAVRMYNQYAEFTKNADLTGMKNMNITPEQIQMLQTFMRAQSTENRKEAP
ncbi:MAG: hypothetical protein EOM34_04755 [Clostridia bacterium]|nr:hypothetical protein [Lachnospiraceae bacterium]NCB99980.1 hypothetical protein [Clostridia bacterium]